MFTPNPASPFAYRAQTAGGDAVSGTIDASSLDEASARLASLQLRVIDINPLSQPLRSRPLKGEDFIAFNTQLAHLTTAGLPVEQGLRLIAEDMRSRRMAQTVREIATELESGKSLASAFETHTADFPPLYSQLVNAGVRSGNLPGMLLNLGRHLELITRLRAMLWQAFSYPIMVLLSLVAVIIFLSIAVFPQLEKIFRDFRTDLPGITVFVLGFSRFVLGIWPVLPIIAIVLLVGVPLIWRLFRRLKWDQPIVEAILFPIPLLGPALRRNALARWCDALKIGIEAGLDLPASLALAADAVGSPRLRKDTAILVNAIQSGQPIDESTPTRLIPPSAISVISLASTHNDLPNGLNTLSLMFQQQAELKLALIPAILTPLLIILIAFIIGVVVTAMFAPLISLIQVVSGPGK